MRIYLIKNIINGKIYVGKTKNSLACRWSGHKSVARNSPSTSPIYNAIRKYGEDNFSIEEIDRAESLSELKRKEFYWINHYNTIDKKIGYNIQYGDEDDNLIISQDTKIKLVKSIKDNKRNGFIKYPNSKHRTIYVGVYYMVRKKQWGYVISFNSKKTSKKRYATDTNAAIGRDIKLLELFPIEEALSLMNFPNNLECYKLGLIVDSQYTRKIEDKKSIYRRVIWNKINKKWESSIVYKQKRYRNGLFETEKEAAEKSDWFMVNNNFSGDLNFPHIDYSDPTYNPPKRMSEKFPYPKYISCIVLKNGLERFRVRVIFKKVDRYFDSLEDAIKFQKTII